MKTSFYSHSLADLQALFASHDLPPSGPGLLFNWHYKKRRREPCVHNLAKESIRFVEENFHFDLPVIDTVQASTDKTVKFLFRLHDGKKVETVLIPFQGKYTVCLSSQVGCGMKCSFCYTGTQGLARHLETSEIVGQLLAGQRWLTDERPEDDRISNVVFMGQGEPLHNFDAVKKACEIFLVSHGICLADHKITISTAGHLPGLQRWKEEMPDVNIALSLHSPLKPKRDELIPINQRWPLEEVLSIVETIPTKRKRFVTYEILLIRDFNDSEEDAHLVGALLRDKKALVNIIPFNPWPGSLYQRPELASVDSFREIIESYGLPAMVRVTKGDEILAACGQLNSKKEISYQ